MTNTEESQVPEYAHGTTVSNRALATSGEYPVGCSVDEKGDVAVSDTGIGLCEIKAGTTSGTPISLSDVPEFPGQVQWDATYVAIGVKTRIRSIAF